MSTYKRRVVVIALDGCTFRALDRLIDRGVMPSLKRLIEQGCTAVLQSTFPPVTGPAWASFATGMDPGGHGCFNFIYPDGSLSRTRTISTAQMGAKTFYEYLEQAGKRSILVNLPVSYPPRTDNITITSLLTQGDNCIFPESLKHELPELNAYRIVHNVGLRLKGRIDEYVVDIRKLERTRFKCARRLFDREWDFFFILFSGTDWVSHALFDTIIRGLGVGYGEAEKLFREIDGYIEWFRQHIDGNTDLIIMSDHGFRTYERWFCVNEWLLKEGYLNLGGTSRPCVALTKIGKEDVKQQNQRNWLVVKTPLMVKNMVRKHSGLALGLRRVRKFIEQRSPLKFERKETVDLTRTYAYCIDSHSGGVFINDKGRFKDGTVEPGARYELLREEIIHKLMQLKDESGKPVLDHIWRKEELYQGSMLRDAPDILLSSERYVVRANFSTEVLQNRRQNYHDPFGVFIGYGTDFKKGCKLTSALNIIDLAPTLLYILGEAIPKDMQGKVAEEALEPTLLHEAPPKYLMSSSRRETRFISNRDNNDEATVKHRLKGLGYLE